MRVRLNHIIHSVALLAVLTLLGFASLFLVDRFQTGDTYSHLEAHRVAVQSQIVGCGRYSCLVTYQYAGQKYFSSVGFGASHTFYVDPLNTTYRLNKDAFDGAAKNRSGDLVFAILLVLGAALVTAVHQLHIHRSHLARAPSHHAMGLTQTTGTGHVREPLVEGTRASYDDPDIAAIAGPEPPEPEVFQPGTYWRLRPGEPIDQVASLPKRRSNQPVVFFGGPRQRLLLDMPHGRRIIAVPANAEGLTQDAVACKMVVILTRHRAEGHVNDPDRFLVLLNVADVVVARLDFSDSWELRTDSLERICGVAGLAFAVETYESDEELLEARPEWTTASVALAIEHPVDANIRDFGMALWYGTGLAVLLSSTGMELVFGTPVRFVVITLAAGGLIVASIIRIWSNVHWKSRQKSLAARKAVRKGS